MKRVIGFKPTTLCLAIVSKEFEWIFLSSNRYALKATRPAYFSDIRTGARDAFYYRHSLWVGTKSGTAIAMPRG
jgi:hypothetical protein